MTDIDFLETIKKGAIMSSKVISSAVCCYSGT